jgi:hypothetical protein
MFCDAETLIFENIQFYISILFIEGKGIPTYYMIYINLTSTFGYEVNCANH